MSSDVIIVGGGGHARVVADTLHAMRVNVIGYLAPTPSDDGMMNIPYLGDDEDILNYSRDSLLIANGVGSVARADARAGIYNYYKERGYRFISLIHPSAVVAESTCLGEGCQVMAGAVVQPGVNCEENVIINTRAGVDHDCKIGAHAHVSIGATLAGDVRIGSKTHVGAGSVVIEGVSIGGECVVAAGAVVVRNVPNGQTVVGVPARRLVK